jgi:hypothetical protein
MCDNAMQSMHLEDCESPGLWFFAVESGEERDDVSTAETSTLFLMFFLQERRRLSKWPWAAGETLLALTAARVQYTSSMQRRVGRT